MRRYSGPWERKSQLHRRFLPAIKESSGLDPLDHEVQYFYAALEAQEVTETQQFTAALQAHRLRAEWIDGPAARALEPLFTFWEERCTRTAFRWMPIGLSRLSQAAQRHGAQLQYGEVVGLQRAGEQVTGVLLKDGHHYVRDPGAGHGRLDGCGPGAVVGSRCADWSVSPPEAARPPSRSCPRCAVRWGDVNMVARRDGVMHVGSKHDPTGFEGASYRYGQALAVGTVPDGLPESGG